MLFAQHLTKEKRKCIVFVNINMKPQCGFNNFMYASENINERSYKKNIEHLPFPLMVITF